MASDNVYKDDRCYMENGKIVLDTAQKRVAAEMSLQKGNLRFELNSYRTKFIHFEKKLHKLSYSGQAKQDADNAWKSLNNFKAEIAPISEYRSLKQLQSDLKELETIEKTMSITDPEHAKIMMYIDKRNEDIKLLQSAINESYASDLKKLETLNTTQSNLGSAWKGNYSRSHIADLVTIFTDKKASATDESLDLLKKTISLVQENPARAENLVERVKNELAQQEKTSVQTTTPNKTTHVEAEAEAQEERRFHP